MPRLLDNEVNDNLTIVMLLLTIKTVKGSQAGHTHSFYLLSRIAVGIAYH